MKILILGYSSIVRRRVIPALISLGVKRLDIASRSGAATLPPGVEGAIFNDYFTALRSSDASLVYVSTVNSIHAELAAAALDCDRHVVIDKPAALWLSDARDLVAAARAKGRLIAEANVFGLHPQMAAARLAFDEIASRPTQLVAAFSFPPLPRDNFRHRFELGGGAFWDLGPYAVSTGRLFFADEPVEIDCRTFYRPGEDVDCGFSLLMTYPGNRSLVGHFGATTGYVNRLEALGSDASVTLEPAFTTPPALACQIRVNQRNQRRIIEVPAADTFALFLNAVFTAISTGACEPFADEMLAVAALMDALRANTRRV